MAVFACSDGGERAHFVVYADAGDGGEAGGRPSDSIAADGSGGASSRDGGTPHASAGAVSRGGSASTDASVIDAASAADASSGMLQPDADAASIADAEPAGCAMRSVWYADDDHDGFGDGARLVVACGEPSSGTWANRADDCDDGDARVHPGQMAYFGEPYSARSGDDSFDYDCSGSEDGDPSLVPAPANCALLAVGSCGGSGYLPTARAGAGKNPLCGSVQTRSCSAALVICTATEATVEKAFGCR